MPSLITIPLITEALGLLARVDEVCRTVIALEEHGVAGLGSVCPEIMTLERELTEYSCRVSLGLEEPAAEALARTVQEARDLLKGYGPRGEAWLSRTGSHIVHAYGADGLPVCRCSLPARRVLWYTVPTLYGLRRCTRCQAALGAARSRGAGAAVAEVPS